MILVVLAIVFGTLVVLELAALAGRRAWVNWKLGGRRELVDASCQMLVDALVFGTAVEPPAGRVHRRVFRLAALELSAVLSGKSHERLARLVEDAGVVDDAMRALRRSRLVYVRRRSADGLGELRSRHLVPEFEAGLEDRDAIVRVACARGLLHIPELGRLDRILEVLDRDALAEPVETAAALIALAEAAPSALVQFHDSASTPTARWYAALVLARMKHAEGMPTLLAALASPTRNALMVSHSIHGISAIGGPEAVAVLEGVAGDADRDAAIRDLATREFVRLKMTDEAA